MKSDLRRRRWQRPLLVLPPLFYLGNQFWHHNKYVTHVTPSITKKSAHLINNNTRVPHRMMISRTTLPNVLLIGAQKAGTSAITKLLFDNGICYGLSRKEIHYFDHSDKFRKGKEYYIEQFRRCKKELYNPMGLTMDATPNTLMFPERVYNTYQDVAPPLISKLKLILILRDPLSRELSRYYHMKALYLQHSKKEWVQDVAFENRTVKSFEQYVAVAMERKGHKAFKYSFYIDHIKKWHELFGREKLLVLSYDELKENPARLRKRIEEFLGIKLDGEMEYRNQKQSKHKTDTISESVLQTLGPMFAAKNKELYEFLDKHRGPPMEERPFRKFETYNYATPLLWNEVAA